MTTPRAGKKDGAKTPARLTPYAIFIPIQDTDEDDKPVTLWRRAAVRTMDAHGAHDAIRRWALMQGTGFAGGQVMAVPERSLSVVDVKVETRRQLTLGAPGGTP